MDGPTRRAIMITGGGACALASGSMALGRGALRPKKRPSESLSWVFDRLDTIGGLIPHIEGQPKLIDTALGRAVEFNGVDDALFFNKHPLAGASQFTFEALIRPDGGAFEQRWFHLASDEIVGPPAKPTNTRFLFEIRVVGQEWYLDAFTQGAGYKQTLVFPDKRFAIKQWAHVAQSYDGKLYRSFVNGVEQGHAYIDFSPQGPGKSSVGVRMNHVNYFKGAIREAIFNFKALDINGQAGRIDSLVKTLNQVKSS